METLAYLHSAENYENSDIKELDLKKLKTVAVAGAIGAASVVGGVVTTAESASAYGVRYQYYSYRPCYRPCYYPRYYSYRPCHRYYY